MIQQLLVNLLGKIGTLRPLLQHVKKMPRKQMSFALTAISGGVFIVRGSLIDSVGRRPGCVPTIIEKVV